MGNNMAKYYSKSRTRTRKNFKGTSKPVRKQPSAYDILVPKMTPELEYDVTLSAPNSRTPVDDDIVMQSVDCEALPSGITSLPPNDTATDAHFRQSILSPRFFGTTGSPWQRAAMLNKASKLLCFVTVFLSFLVVILIVAWISSSHTASKEEVCEEPACVEAASQILKFIDSKVDPCQDFYKFACGRWLTTARIPYGESSLSSFQMLGDRMNDDLINLFAKPPRNKSLRKIHYTVQTFFESCMDTVSIDQLGLSPLINHLRQLGLFNILVYGGLVNTTSPSSDYNVTAAKERFALDAFSLTHISMIPFFFSTEATRDSKDLKRNVIRVKLNVCNIKEIYATDTDFTRKYIQAYKILINQTSESLQGTELFRDLNPDGIHDFCNELSQIERPAEWLRDPENVYNPYKLSELPSHCKWMNMTQQIQKIFQFANVQVLPDDIVVLEHPQVLQDLCDVLASFLETPDRRKSLYDFIFFKMFQANVKFLPDFYYTPLITFTRSVTGVQGHTERSKKCQVYTSEEFLNELVGVLYIKEYFPDFTRSYVEDMIGNIQKVAKELLSEADWMEATTKAKAIHKVQTMTINVGYKDELMDTKMLERTYNFNLTYNRFLDNVIQIYTALVMDEYGRLRTVEKEDWRPQEVNAFYDPRRNNIVVPVGILQGVFFNKRFPSYMNYGGIGVVLGHELGHGFDDSGRKFDYSGLLKEWWDPDTSHSYVSKTQCFLNQYNNYSLYGYNVNGNKTMGENIADNMGIKLSFRAFQQHAKRNISRGRLPGLPYTPEQIFFISFAHIWCSLSTKEYIISNILSDEHAPDKFRIIGTVSNSEEFSKAFHCSSRSAMNPPNKCSVV